MHDQVVLHQKFEKWKSKATEPIVACIISRSKVVDVCLDSSICRLLVEGLHQSWRIERSFHDFHVLSFQLMHAFPSEAGKRGYERILPACPIPKRLEHLFSRTETLKHAMKGKLDEFCRLLFSLAPYISRSRLVLDFFLPRSADAALTLAPLLGSSSFESLSIRTRSIYSGSNGTSSTSDLDVSRVLIKVVAKGQIITIEHDEYESGKQFFEKVKKRLKVSTSIALYYFDPQCEKIHITDLEDLALAIAILGNDVMLYFKV